MKSFTHPISPLPGRSLSKLTEDMANHARCIRELQGVKQSAPKTRPVGGGGGTTGPFCRVFQSEGAWYLTGGTVTGGEGNVTVPDIDLGDVGDEPADGTFFWLVCSGDAITEDDVLLAGFDLATATVGSGTSLPSNTIPTALAPAGVLHVSLGSWSAGKFVPAGCGNLQISHCPGTLSYARG